MQTPDDRRLIAEAIPARRAAVEVGETNPLGHHVTNLTITKIDGAWQQAEVS